MCQCQQYLLTQNDDNIRHLIVPESLKALNAQTQTALKSLFRDEEHKHLKSADAVVESFPDDAQLVIIVRFSEEVRLRAIDVVCPRASRPSSLSIYVNVEHFAFRDTRNPPTQHFPLTHFTADGEVEVYPTLRQGTGTHTLVLHFKGEAVQVGVSYIGLKGCGTGAKQRVLRGEYEIRNTKGGAKVGEARNTPQALF